MLDRIRTHVATTAALAVVLGTLAYSRTAQGNLIDGDLSDWGVTPFADWEPDGLAIYVQANHPNRHFPNGGERFDIEAMYMARAGDRLCIGIITSFPESGLANPNNPNVWIEPGDLLLDVGHDDIWEWEFAVLLNGPDKGDLYYRPALHLPQGSSGFPANGPGSVYIGQSLPPIGSVQVAWHNYGDLEGWGSDTYGIEIGIDLSYLGDPEVLDVRAHHTMGCGNDLIELSGPLPSPVPEPVTSGLLLAGGLLLGAGCLTRRRTGHTR